MERTDRLCSICGRHVYAASRVFVRNPRAFERPRVICGRCHVAERKKTEAQEVKELWIDEGRRVFDFHQMDRKSRG